MSSLGEVTSPRLEREEGDERYWVLYLEDLDEWPDDLAAIGGRFRLFLAIDASGISDQAIEAAAREALKQGAVYVCVWGPDCELTHDTFDHVANEAGLSSEKAVIMTTWHADESLADAVEFFLRSTIPDESYADGCNDWLVVAVGRREWSEQLSQLVQELIA